MGERGPIGAADGAKLSYKPGAPKMPLGLDERGVEIYKATCRHLKAAGVLQVVDGSAVAKYAQWFSTWEREIRYLNAEGAVTVPLIEELEAKVNPRLMAIHKIDTMLASAEKKLGFAPEDRMRIRPPAKAKQSPLDKLKGKVGARGKAT